MATFEQLQKANESIRTVNIKGKEYAEVNQRIKAFRMVYPEGFIDTEIVSLENGVCVMKASAGVYKVCDDPQSAIPAYYERIILGTGTAYEKESSTFINKTSYIENCETSAVGRALGMAGFGIDTSVASAEEVETAIANQDDGKKITATKAKTLEKMIISHNVNVSDVLKYYGHDELKEFTEKEFATVLKQLEAKERSAEHE